MKDPRYELLARQIVGYSVRVQPGEHVNLRMQDIPDAMVVELIRAVRAAGGCPHVNLRHARVTSEMFAGATDAQYESIAGFELAEMKAMDAYIAIRGGYNSF